jgi:hypothetical protein
MAELKWGFRKIIGFDIPVDLELCYASFFLPHSAKRQVGITADSSHEKNVSTQ